MTTERRYTPAEVAALLDATSAGSAEREALDRLYPMEVAAAQWEQVRQKAVAPKASQEEQAERRYEESVQHRLSDLRHERWFWDYGHIDGKGWGIWEAVMGPRDWTTNSCEQEDDWESFESAADETAARAEATRRNRGEG